MNRFVAIDLGARRVQVVIQDADGVVLVNSNLEARLDPVLDLMRRHGALNARVAIEAGFGWHWLADGLQDAGADVRLVHPAACAMLPRCIEQNMRTASRNPVRSRSASGSEVTVGLGLVRAALLTPNDQHHRAAADGKVVRERVDRRSGACHS